MNEALGGTIRNNELMDACRMANASSLPGSDVNVGRHV